jgi:hypothetical protein
MGCELRLGRCAVSSSRCAALPERQSKQSEQVHDQRGRQTQVRSNAIERWALSAVAPNLTNLELDMLRKLVNGELVSVPPRLRLRLELAGVIREGAQGIVVTPGGRRLASQQPAVASPDSPSPQTKVAVDRRGRRMPLQRKSVF